MSQLLRNRRMLGATNVYTVMLLVALVVLLGGVVYVAGKNMQVSGSGNPLHVVTP